MSRVDETIVAIASPPGSAVRGIVRFAGPDAVSIWQKLFRIDEQRSPKTPAAKSVLHGQCQFDHDRWIDAMALVWPDQRSYTRQPTVEVHTTGATPILNGIVHQVCRSGGRLAEPGEFTMRAFLAGRIDLTQAEAVLAAIDAESESQFDAAVAQLAGGLAGPLQELRGLLLYLLAELEAGLDFAEEDIEFISSAQLLKRLSECHTSLEAIIAQIESRDSADTMPKVALIGRPNAGKSSLLNCLAERDQAIVTPVAGTTTDFVTAVVELRDSSSAAALAIQLIDTAGVEQARDEIMAQAQSHRQQQASQADCRVLCIDVSLWLKSGDESAFRRWNRQQVQQLHPNDIVLLTKMDQVSKVDQRAIDGLTVDLNWSGECLAVSVVSNLGLEQLRSLLLQKLSAAVAVEGSVVATTVSRAAESLDRANEALQAAVNAAEQSFGEEIVAAEIREALQELANVVGEVYTDDILDVVFGKFCIGK